MCVDDVCVYFYQKVSFDTMITALDYPMNS